MDSYDALELNQSTFQSDFPERPFLVRHKLADQSLFDLERLLTLSKALPESSVEYNAGELPVTQDPYKTPRNGLSIQETIARIRDCRSWLVLKNVEQDPEYAGLLNRCLDQVTAAAMRRLGRSYHREGFIFISSPGAVTPYHTDPEHNFLLQIRGSKTVHIFDGADRSIISEQELEAFHSGSHRNLRFRDEIQPRARSFTLTPGMGLHFPVNDPHWVKNGDEVSVSFSITFRSPRSDRKARVHFVNSKLRRFGLTPVAVGVSSWRDALKDSLLASYQGVRRIIGRSTEQRRY